MYALGCIVLVALAAALTPKPQTRAADRPAVLSDPVALGAWLYNAHCVRCHGGYDNERPASGYDDRKDLMAAVGERGCRVKWNRRYGGVLKDDEISALADFMLTWEARGGPPPLPELPPPPEPEKAPAGEIAATPLSGETPAPLAPQPDPDAVSPALKSLLETNAVASGAWLYTRNCYRCHLNYDRARMGKGISTETLRRTIASGKTSTQMTAFSIMGGGKLKNREIDHIVAYITTYESFGEPPALAEAVTRPPKPDPTAIQPVGLPRFPVVSGNLETGARIYVRRCSPCHGSAGEGYVGRPLAKTWTLWRPDLFIKSVLKQGVPGTAMPAWSQNTGGALSAREIDDLVTFVGAMTEQAP